jgi:hypothetical protein
MFCTKALLTLSHIQNLSGSTEAVCMCEVAERAVELGAEEFSRQKPLQHLSWSRAFSLVTSMDCPRGKQWRN